MKLPEGFDSLQELVAAHRPAVYDPDRVKAVAEMMLQMEAEGLLQANDDGTVTVQGTRKQLMKYGIDPRDYDMQERVWDEAKFTEESPREELEAALEILKESSANLDERRNLLEQFIDRPEGQCFVLMNQIGWEAWHNTRLPMVWEKKFGKPTSFDGWLSSQILAFKEETEADHD